MFNCVVTEAIVAAIFAFRQPHLSLYIFIYSVNIQYVDDRIRQNRAFALIYIIISCSARSTQSATSVWRVQRAFFPGELPAMPFIPLPQVAIPIPLQVKTHEVTTPLPALFLRYVQWLLCARSGHYRLQSQEMIITPLSYQRYFFIHVSNCSFQSGCQRESAGRFSIMSWFAHAIRLASISGVTSLSGHRI